MGSLRSLRGLRRKDVVRLTPTPDQLQEQLFNAVYEGTVADVKALLRAGADPNGWRDTEWTPLTWAAISGMITKVRLLLKHGADVNERSSDGFSPMVSAATNGTWKAHLVLEILLDNGADVNHRCHCDSGDTPLLAAVLMQDTQSVKLLLERGADATVRNSKGRTALDLVEDNDSWRSRSIKELLLKKSA